MSFTSHTSERALERLAMCAALLGAAALGGGSVAQADDRLCPVPDAPGMSVQVPVYERFELAADAALGGRGLRDLESIEVGPFFSSDGTALVSGGRLPSAPVAAPSLGRAPLDVLWCRGANDPRCNGGDPAPDALTNFDVTHAGAAVIEARAAIGRASLAGGALAPDDEGPRDGVQSELERPPRR